MACLGTRSFAASVLYRVAFMGRTKKSAKIDSEGELNLGGVPVLT